MPSLWSKLRNFPRDFVSSSLTLMNQIMKLKFTSKTLLRQARRCEKEARSEKLKALKVPWNINRASICFENSYRKSSERMNCLRLASRLDDVVFRLETQAMMTKSIVRSLESSLATGDLQKMSETMDRFEKQFMNMEIQLNEKDEKVDEDDLSTGLAQLN